jgi:hypothetical protein
VEGAELAALLAGLDPARYPTAATVLTVDDPSACPWPVSLRAGRCAACRDHGGTMAIISHGIRQRYATAGCLAAQAAARRAELLEGSGLDEKARRHSFAALRRDRWNRAVLAELEAWQPGIDPLPAPDGVARPGMYLTRAKEGISDWWPTNKRSNGTGKSLTLHALALGLVAREVRCAYLKEADLLKSLQALFGVEGGGLAQAQILNFYATVPVLLIDDLGKDGAQSDWACGRWYEVLDRRVEAGRCTIVSTNYELLELRERYGNGDTGAAIMSRLARGCAVRRLGGPDWNIERALRGEG